MPSLLLVLLLAGAAAVAVAGIGVNYGTVADNLPPPPDVAAFLRDRTTITAVKLFAPDPALISAFASTPISLTVTVPNSDVPSLAAPGASADWVRQKLAPFHPAVRISRLAVGNEVIATADKALIAHLLPAMKALHAALRSAGMSGVEVCSPHSLGVLSSSEPPSSGRFRRGYDKVIFAPMLEFHRETKSKFMVNPYPFFGFTNRTLDYALFKPNPGVHDAATGMNYTNMFDAQMDAVHSAMKRLGYGDVEVAVGETGWPSVGDADQPAVSLENARLYNGNLVRHVESGKGTPLMPGRKFETFIFALFNEDLKPTTSERNYGLFRPDFSVVYDVGVLRAGQSRGGAAPAPARPMPSGGGRQWCVAKAGATPQALQSNIDYACNQAGVDCSAIQAGGSCFKPDTVESHAAYAMNAYFQGAGRHDFNCDFGQTGTITAYDPSYDSCKYSA